MGLILNYGQGHVSVFVVQRRIVQQGGVHTNMIVRMHYVVYKPYFSGQLQGVGFLFALCQFERMFVNNAMCSFCLADFTRYMYQSNGLCVMCLCVR